MGKRINLSGRRFGKLTVVEMAEPYHSPGGYKATNWRCVCDCGKHTIVRTCNLRNGKSLSCGCLRVESPNRKTHGQNGTRLYGVWKSIRQRCKNPSSSSYEDYGGRGIQICAEWDHDFNLFYEWSLANGYQKGLTIDRIDNNGDYAPSNCRWTTLSVQGNNTRRNHFITYNGETLTVAQWAEKTGIKYHKLKDRINKLGWTAEKALTAK